MLSGHIFLSISTSNFSLGFQLHHAASQAEHLSALGFPFWASHTPFHHSPSTCHPIGCTLEIVLVSPGSHLAKATQLDFSPLAIPVLQDKEDQGIFETMAGCLTCRDKVRPLSHPAGGCEQAQPGSILGGGYKSRGT